MRYPARPNPNKQKTSVSTTLPVPILGLNAKDDIANMGPQYARSMVNIFPDSSTCTVRGGYTEFATTMTNSVRSLIPWVNGSGTVKILAATSDTVFDASSAGTAATLGTSYTNGDYQYVEITTAGGHYTLFCNGADTVKQYDGSSVSAPSYSGTGFTSANMVGVTTHKSRVWFIEINSADTWYLGTDAIAGAASKYPLGGALREGGYIMAAGTYSADAGDGMDDYMAFISSQGEVLLYAGTDPSSANTWALVTRLYTAPPLGRKCLANIGGDLLILTKRGVMSVEALLKYDRAQQEYASVSNKIDPLIIDAATNYGSATGWQLEVHAKKNMLFLNIPVSEDSSYKQFVMNILTGAWCEYNDINSASWLSTGDSLYFGGTSGSTWAAESGYQDNGGAISGKIRTAWNYLDTPGIQKNITLIRPVTTSAATPAISIRVNADYLDEEPSGTVAPNVTTGATWGVATWDSAYWGGNTAVTQKWTSTRAVGMCISVALNLQVNGGECNIHAFDAVGVTGGTL